MLKNPFPNFHPARKKKGSDGSSDSHAEVDTGLLREVEEVWDPRFVLLRMV